MLVFQSDNQLPRGGPAGGAAQGVDHASLHLFWGDRTPEAENPDNRSAQDARDFQRPVQDAGLIVVAVRGVKGVLFETLINVASTGQCGI